MSEAGFRMVPQNDRLMYLDVDSTESNPGTIQDSSHRFGDGYENLAIMTLSEVPRRIYEDRITVGRVFPDAQIDTTGLYCTSSNNPVDLLDYLGLRAIRVPGTNLTKTKDECPCLEGDVRDYVNACSGNAPGATLDAACVGICQCFFGNVGHVALTKCMERCQNCKLHKWY